MKKSTKELIPIDGNFKKYLLQATNSTDARPLEIIQSLWSGFGHIVRYQLIGSELNTVVVKQINLSKSKSHPKGWNTQNSLQRKVKSYQVETNWYRNWSHKCDNNCKTPMLLGEFTISENQWLILEDLQEYYPMAPPTYAGLLEVKLVLKWLACFHAKFMGQQPNDLWPIGTYWHLATRQDEFEKIEYQELKSKARLIDKLLNNCEFKTIVHGDAKIANFCFAENEVAAVDFQYVGVGCGMKDVAYFFTSCLSESTFVSYEQELLSYYFLELEKALKKENSNIDFSELEQEWRAMYPLAYADFVRFILGWDPSHRKITGYSLKVVQGVLDRLMQE